MRRIKPGTRHFQEGIALFLRAAGFGPLDALFRIRRDIPGPTSWHNPNTAAQGAQ